MTDDVLRLTRELAEVRELLQVRTNERDEALELVDEYDADRLRRVRLAMTAEWNGAGAICPHCKCSPSGHHHACPRSGRNTLGMHEREAARLRTALANIDEVTDLDRVEFSRSLSEGKVA